MGAVAVFLAAKRQGKMVGDAHPTAYGAGTEVAEAARDRVARLDNNDVWYFVSFWENL